MARFLSASKSGEGPGVHPPSTTTRSKKGVMNVLSHHLWPSNPPGKHHADQPRRHRKLAVATTGAIILATVAVGGGVAHADLAPGSMPGAGVKYTFSDGSQHWFGMWLLPNGTQLACLDANRNQPLSTGGTTYTTSTITGDYPTAYLLSMYGGTTDNVQGEALSNIVHLDTRLTHRDIGAYHFANPAPYAGVQAEIIAMKAEAAQRSGPLTIKINVTNPTAGSNTGSATVALVNAAGVDQAGYTVTLSGATGLPASILTKTTPVKVSFSATNAQTGTITGKAANLPATTITKYTAADPTFQNLVGSAPKTSTTGSAAYARPAAPSGGVIVSKISSTTGAGLASAVFQLHSGSATGTVVSTRVTAAGGKASVINAAPGTYVLVETAAPPASTAAPAGYTKSANITVTITNGSTKTVTVKDTPIPVAPNVGTAQAVKVSSADAAVGLAGAQIHIHAGTATGADKGTLTTTAGGKSNVLTLAPGTYVGVETVAPGGYQRNAPNVTFTVTKGKLATITFKDAPVVVVPKESAVSVLKAADDTTGTIAGKFGPLAGTTWTASSSDGKTVLGTDVSDSDGKVYIPVDVAPGTDVLLTETSSGSADYTVAAPMHVTSTIDGSGTALYTAVDHRIVPHLVLTKTIVDPKTHQVIKGMSPAGAYYKLTNTDTGAVINAKAGPTNTTGQLTGDLSALRAGDNVTAVEVVSPVQGAIDPTPFSGTVTSDSTGNLNIVLAQADVPVTIGTDFTNQAGGTKFFQAGEIGIDAVDYTGLLPGREATAEGSASCLNSDGSLTPIPGAAGSTTFTPTAANGTVNVTIKLPAGMTPCVVSVYEQMVVQGTVVADENKGGTDTHQQGYMPVIGTTLINKADGSKIFHPGDTGVDAVAYSGAQTGVSTTVKGSASCINLYTGVQTPIPGATGSVTFTPTSWAGTVNVTIKLPSTMAPCTITIYEQWIVGGKVITDHNKSGTDSNEQGNSPVIATTLTNAANGSKYFAWGDTGTDALTYSGITPGVSATAVATAYCLNADNSLSVIPGAFGTRTFTVPASGAGLVDVDVKIPNQLGTPCTITIYEKVLVGGKLIAEHNRNGQDHNEQGHMPTLKTTLVGPDGAKATVIDSTSTPLTDQVACFDVINGEKYYVTGDLRLDDGSVKGKDTGITGKGAVFTATGSKLCTTVDFRLTGTLLPAGSSATIVAFEYLHLAATGATIARHEQIKDVDQALGVQHPAAGAGGGGTVSVNTGLGADNTSSTGDIIAGSIGIAAVLGLLALGLTIAVRRRRTNSVGTPQ